MTPTQARLALADQIALAQALLERLERLAGKPERLEDWRGKIEERTRPAGTCHVCGTKVRSA